MFAIHKILELQLDLFTLHVNTVICD